MNEVGLRQTLLSVSGSIKVYVDFVPEGTALPAIAYTHLANNGNRVLKGTRTSNWDTWRVSVIAKTRSEYKTIVDAIKTLDNTSNTHFKNIFVLFDGGVPALPDDDTRTAIVDLKTYG